jgi:hypothetical protein
MPLQAEQRISIWMSDMALEDYTARAFPGSAPTISVLYMLRILEEIVMERNSIERTARFALCIN